MHVGWKRSFSSRNRRMATERSQTQGAAAETFKFDFKEPEADQAWVNSPIEGTRGGNMHMANDLYAVLRGCPNLFVYILFGVTHILVFKSEKNITFISAVLKNNITLADYVHSYHAWLLILEITSNKLLLKDCF